MNAAARLCVEAVSMGRVRVATITLMTTTATPRTTHAGSPDEEAARTVYIAPRCGIPQTRSVILLSGACGQVCVQ